MSSGVNGSLHTAAIAGALFLVPGNAHHEGALFSLLRSSLAGDSTGLEHPSPEGVRALLRDHAGILWDSPETLFTTRLAFPGGDYLALTGGFLELDTGVRHLLAALLLHKEPPPRPLREAALRLALAVLHLSDHVTRTAGLRRHVRCASANMPIVPPGALLADLIGAVTFRRDELASVVRVGLEALDPLVLEVGGVEAPGDGIAPFGRTPILRHGDRFVVAAPSCLLLALRHHLLSLARRHGWAEELALRARAAAANDVRASLKRLGWTAVPLEPVPDESLPVSEQLWSFDADAVALVTVLGDDLAWFQESDPEYPWSPLMLREAISRRRDELIEELYLGEVAPKKVMHLVVLAGAGSGGSWASEIPAEPLLVPEVAFTVGDLGSASVAERGDPLVLWKYAVAADRLEAQVIALSPLELFALWRDELHSFYLSDGARPTAVVSEGRARALREDIAVRRDVHAVMGPHGRGVVEVARRYEDMEVPIHAPTTADVAGYHVASGELQAWVLAGGERSEMRGLVGQLVEMVAYWLWRAGPELKSVASALTRERFEVVVRLDDDPGWIDGATSRTGPVATASALGQGQLDLLLHASLLDPLNRADNEGERRVLRILLRALGEALPEAERRGWDDGRADRVVEQIAPLGVQKMMLVFGSGQERALDNRNLPPSRPPFRDADDAEAMDELGEHLRGARGLRVGPVADERRGAVLWDAVQFHLGQLSTLISTLSPDGLLERLIASHERLLQRGAWERHTVPTRQACFGEVSDIEAVLREELPRAATAGTGIRFVIEHVAAHPPAGIRPPTLEVQDRLVALAAQVCARGAVAEAVREGLDDTRISILESGRLGTGRDGRFYSGRDRYFEHFLSAEVRRAHRFFAGHWDEPDSGGQAVADAERLNEGARSEWGLTLTEVLELFAELVELADGRPAVTLALDDAVAAMADDLGWAPAKVASAVDHFALRPRNSLLSPPPPYKAHDVYPWRFSRRLSLIRRPLILRPSDEGTQLVYGYRLVDMTGRWLVNEIQSTRLKVESREMRKVMTAMGQRQDRNFNDEVGRAFAAVPGMIVRERVTDIGQLKIARPNGDVLGDIDVLAADTQLRVLNAIDTKNLAVARTPIEVARELRRTFRGDDAKTASIDTHLERAEWLRQHLRATLEWLGLCEFNASEWRVDPAIVVDTEVPSAFLEELPMRVVDAPTLDEELRQRVAAAA